MVTAMFFTGNSRTLATASKKDIILFWDMEDSALYHTEKKKLGGINALALSSDGRTLAIGLADDTVRIVDSQGFDESLRLTGYHNPVRAMEISPNNQFIASGSENKLIIAANKRAGAYYEVDAHEGDITALTFEPLGRKS